MLKEECPMSGAKVLKAARNYWDKEAEGYSERRTKKSWMKEIDETVLNLLEVGPDSLVLDVGVGPGIFATHLAKMKLSEVVGLDISKKFLNIAKNKIKTTSFSNRVLLVVASADSLPLRKSIFDAATSMVTIHHLPPSRVQESFREIQRVLKEEGKFVLVESWAYEPRNEFQRIVLELRRMLEKTETEEYHLEYWSYIKMIEKAGLKILGTHFQPRPPYLSRFERLTDEKARKLLNQAKQFNKREQYVDMTIIHTIKQID